MFSIATIRRAGSERPIPFLSATCIVSCMLAVMLFLGTSTVNAQQISLKTEKASLKSVFSEIRKQTGYLVLYKSVLINNAKPVTVTMWNVPLSKALEVILNGQGLDFKIEDKSIIIKPASERGKEQQPGQPQLMNFQGSVMDEDGKPLNGASVRLLGSDTASITNAQGTFSLQGEIGRRVMISCIGFRQLTFSLRVKYFDVHLEREVSKLDEVQVIAYGSSTRRLNTGTVSSLNAKEIATQPVTNVLAALNGRLTGVRVEQANGMAGAAVTIKVRGDNTLGPLGSTNSDPLYVIDGIPQASGTRYDIQNAISNIRGMNSYTNVFSTLNKEDIERIDVLKDADATAIYGARGANGVVLITTKKGRAGRIRVNFNLTAGAGKVAYFVPMLNTDQYLELRREAFKNENITPTASNAPDLVSWDQHAYTDFQRMLLGGAAIQGTANVSMSGGSDLVNYYVGLNYRKEGTVVADDQHVNRTGGLVNLGIKSPNRKFSALFSANYAEEVSKLNARNLIDLIYLPPNFNLYKPDGSLNWNNNFDNPSGLLLTTYRAKNVFFNGNVTLSYNVMKGLTLKTVAGYSTSRIDNSTQIPKASINPVSGRSANARFGESPTSNFIVEPQAEYIFNIGKGAVTALVGGTLSQALSETTVLTGTNYAYDSQLGAIAGAGIVNTTYKYNQYRYASAFSRVSYDLHNKYLFNVTFRRDASSRFGPENRLASFASVGGAWIFYEEDFIKKTFPALSFGKIKISYGSTGNDRIDNYLYLLNYFSDGIYQDIRTLSPVDQAVNPAIKWESTRKAEINVSLGFLQDRLLFTGNLYRNRSSNLLNFTRQTSQSGVTTGIENLNALVQNKGLELELNTRNVEKKEFTWTTGFNISFERNKLLRFDDIDRSWSSDRYYIGEAVDVFLYRTKYKYAGVDPAKGVPVYTNLDGEAGLGPKDRYITSLGNPFYGGINNSFTFRGFSLDIFFKFQQSRGAVNELPTPQKIVPGGLMNQSTAVLNRWRQAGDEGVEWPLAVTGKGNLSSDYSYLSLSDFTYGNTSYVKLKTVNLSYRLPGNWINRLKMQSMTVSIQGQNLFTWAKDRYVLDPEYAYGTMPGLRTILVGINCSL